MKERNSIKVPALAWWLFVLSLPAIWVIPSGCMPPTPPAERVWPISSTVTPDAPLSSAFGPRLKFSENNHYDFHRAIDIPTPVGSNVHAIAAGTVRLAGEYASYSDKVVQITHLTEGGEVYYSNYIHLSEVLAEEDQVVKAGDVIGLSGIGDSGFPHLHFEIRDRGLYQRNCINPFGVLPYADANVPAVTIDTVDVTTPTAPVVTVTVSLPRGAPDDELDFNALTVITWETEGDAVTKLSEQTFDMEAWNYDYTPLPPEDSTAILDNPDFNDVHVAPESFTTSATEYAVHFTFQALTGPAGAARLKVTAAAYDVMGNATQASYP